MTLTGVGEDERGEVDAELTACLREVNRIIREGGTEQERAASRAHVERLVARIEARP